jgi:hypothetical protein
MIKDKIKKKIMNNKYHQTGSNDDKFDKKN